MSFRFTIATMLILTALIAVGAAAGRAGGPNGVVSFVMAVSGLCVLIRSDWSETVRERIVLIFVGLGLLAWAALWLLPNTR